MINNILSNISLKQLTGSVTLPVHEPISFGFEDMVKAKAEADAAVSAEIERQLVEKALCIGKAYGGISYHRFGKSSKKALSDEDNCGYVYDYNVVAELSVIKRRINRR